MEASSGRKEGVLGVQANVGGLGPVSVRGSDCIWSVWTCRWAGPPQSVAVHCESW